MERANVVPYADAVLGPTRRALWLLLAAVALVLIAACANVANLLLALTSSRMQEVATRAALGASRARLARQFMIESLLLAFAGGVAGVLVARWTTGVLVAFGAERIPRLGEVSFDWTVFVFLLLVCARDGVAVRDGACAGCGARGCRPDDEGRRSRNWPVAGTAAPVMRWLWPRSRSHSSSRRGRRLSSARCSAFANQTWAWRPRTW